MTDQTARLATSLRSSRPASAFLALQDWAQNKTRAQYQDLLRACSDRDRPTIASALREVSAGFPPRWGLPVLMYYQGRQDWLALPASTTQPVPEAVAWHWESASWSPAPQGPAGILADRAQCALLVVRTPNPEPPDIPNEYWNTLFGGLPDGEQIRISARIALPYIDALEAALLLKAVAASGRVPNLRREFLQEHAWQWAVQAGEHFRQLVRG